jgi:hypothetical protein
MDWKICSKCKSPYPATAEFWSPHKRSKDGWFSWCKSCNRNATHARYVVNPEKYRAVSTKWKQDNPEKEAEYRHSNPYMASQRARAAKRSKSIPLLNVWAGMIQRCMNPNATSYPCYGDAGVTVCERWLNSREAFEQDMGERPKGTFLGRFLDIGNYSCGHCEECIANGWLRNVEWQTRTEQGAERSGKHAMLALHNKASLESYTLQRWNQKKLIRQQKLFVAQAA